MISFKDIILVTGIHGDEKVPLIALTSLHIKTLAGNPKALMLNKRFIDYDLNACFGILDKGYESLRAKETLKLIPKNKYVVDFHTTSAKTEPFAIVVDHNLIRLAAQTGLSKVVVMKENIKKGHALINYRKGISIETGNHDSTEAFKTTIKIIHNLKKGRIGKVEIFEVYDIIGKRDDYQNFKKHRDGFYPVLAGEKAYPFFGLKAKKIDFV
jgi:hypothetical protein